jgi:hypothetical protein
MCESWTRARCHTSQAMVLRPGPGASASVAAGTPATARSASGGMRPYSSINSAATSIRTV